MSVGEEFDEIVSDPKAAIRRHDVKFFLALLFVAFILVYYWSNIVISVQSGEQGVLWSRLFGTETNVVYPEGTHLILPINKMTIYNVRYQRVDRSFTVLSKDGLDIKVDTTIRFKPAEKLIGRLHQLVGPDYVETIVVPEVGTAIRTVISKYRPEELYTTAFEEIEDRILELASAEVSERYVVLDDLLLRNITLPPTVADAIQHKLKEEQSALEMQFRIAREMQEAERKRIEATGIKTFQDTVSGGMSDQILQYHGIAATLELAKSPNTKVVIVGGKNGLPMILGSDVLGQPPAPPAK